MDKEKLARSLTAESSELLPYLPYLLQDLWDLGSSPYDMLELVKKHIDLSYPINVLDLACGKGAVSVILAKELDCNVKGIDIFPEFIEVANNKAIAYGVSNLCNFVVGDITQLALNEKSYDLVILGAVGDVLGNPKETILTLKKTIKQDGYILIDDAYGSKGANYDYYTKAEWNQVFDQTHVKLIEDKIGDMEVLRKLNQVQQYHIKARANELIFKYPKQSYLFESYIKSQQEECDQLENKIIGVTMLIQSV